MKSNSRFFNFFLAAIYAAIYNYIYCHYMYGVWLSYVDGSYTPMGTMAYTLYIIIAALPFTLYNGLKRIASAFSLFIYVLVYIPMIESLFVNSYPNFIRIPYMAVFFLMVCGFFMTDNIYLLKRPFRKKRRLIPFGYIIVATFLLLALVLVLNHRQLHLVNLFAVENDLYSLRSETHLSGVYIVCWIRSALLPLLLVYYLNRKSYSGVSIVILSYLLVFMLDKQKMTVIFPFALIVVYYAFLYYKESFGKYFHVFLMTLFAVVSLFFTTIETNPITLALGMIVVLRIQCIAGVQLERYFNFFVLEDNPHTHYTHISIINKLTGAYPFGDQSIGQMVAGDGGNSNAAFWLMDGVAAEGLVGVIIISLIFIIFKSIMNSLDTRCSVGICVTVLLFGIQSMVNVSLMTAILSNGFLILFFLFLFADVHAVERTPIIRRGYRELKYK